MNMIKSTRSAMICLSYQNRLRQTLYIWHKESIGLENVLDNRSLTLTQGYSYGIHLNNCLSAQHRENKSFNQYKT